MADTIYFQWQNDTLLRTIYPLRETKLRDFLIAYQEIDTWKQYRGKTPQDIPADIQAYCDAQRQKLVTAIDNYNRLLAYFLDDDVTDLYQAKYPAPDPDVMLRINALHKAFKTYFPKYNNPLREKYFAAARVSEFEDLRKQVLFQTSEKQRILRNMGPTWGSAPTYQAALDRLANISIKMVDQELSTLYDFAAAQGRMTTYKQQVVKLRTQATNDQTAAASQIAALKVQESAAVASLDTATRALARLQNQPDINALRAYFLTEDVSAQYHAQYPDLDADMMMWINTLHKNVKAYLPGYNNNVQIERYFLGERTREFEDLRKRKQQELNDKQRAAQYMGPDWPNRAANDQIIAHLTSTLKMADQELNKLYDYLWAYDRAAKQPAEISALVAQKTTEQANLQAQRTAIQNNITAQTALQAQAEQTLAKPEKDQLIGLVDCRPIKVEDVARGKIEDYRAALSQKNKDELLEEIVRRFMQDPTRYPLWVQYMVVHFSGMRYQSAHGSWAEPKDLVLALRSKDVADEVKRAKDDAIVSLCEQRYTLYKSQQPTPPGAAQPVPDPNIQDDGTQADIPALAKATDPDWRARIDYHLKHIDPDGYYGKRTAYLNLRIDEETYEVEQMTDPQALDELKGLKDQLPDWMWKEIVQVTDLKLTEVSDANWERLSAQDQEARYTAQMNQYRQIMDQWKVANLTGWRQEHDLTDQLIVTRAVCNEVAEHIQHIRGNDPGGGLTARPEWYLAQSKNAATASQPVRPYFIKARTGNEFRQAASILWLRWVNKEPGPWNITRPLSLNDGDDLYPHSEDPTAVNTGSGYVRTITVEDRDAAGNVSSHTETQYLRWMHEATVMEAAETADGPTVYTFETALPFDIRAQSSIGVFKRMAWDLRYAITPGTNNGVFTGYMPDGAVPYSNLHEMLDWNRVLLRNAYTQGEIDGYWKAVEKPQPVSFALEFAEEWAAFEVAPRLKRQNHSETISCYNLSEAKKRARVYKPVVELSRGQRVVVSLTGAVQIGKLVYYRVVECPVEPLAIGHYLRADELARLPEDQPGLAFQVKETVTALFRPAHSDRGGLPVLDRCPTFLAAGTRLRVSRVHAISKVDKNNGVIYTSDGGEYYLITECPRRASTQGLLIPVTEVKAIEEEEYRGKALVL